MNDGAFQAAKSDYLTSPQKREYLQILLEDGKEAAQQFLNEVEESGGWLRVLPVEMQAAVLMFIPRPYTGTLPLEYCNVLKECRKCHSAETFSQCLKDGKAKIENPNSNK